MLGTLTSGLWILRSTCIQGFGFGIGKGLYVSLFAILAAQGYFNAFAGITLPNPGSVKLHESVGFKPIGFYRTVGYKLGGGTMLVGGNWPSAL